VNLRIIWFWICVVSFFVGFLSLTSITSSAWQALTLWQKGMIFFQVFIGGFGVLTAYWFYSDKKEIEALKKTLERK
jgi:hypothetical protein